jgi:hypothetical protein
MFRKIETTKLTNAEKQTLRNFYNAETGNNHKSISNIARQIKSDNGNEAYEYLRQIYNYSIDDALKEIKTQKRTINKEKQLTKLIATIQQDYNNDLVNTPFVNTTMSNQISMKFAISEYSMQTQYRDFIKHAMEKTAKKYKMQVTKYPAEHIVNGVLYSNLPNEYKYNKKPFQFQTNPDVKKLITRMYDLLMAHSGQYNRIFITNRETGNVVSSALKDNFTYQDFFEVIKNIIQSAGIAVLGTLTFTIQQRNMPKGGASVDVPQFLKGKKGISVIINDDDLCGQRCLVLADCKTNDDLRQMKTDKSKSRFEKKVLDICNELDLKGRMSFIDFDKYADNRQKQIIIVSGLFVVMYETITEYEEQVYIYYDTAVNHYHFIHDINSASNDSKCNNKWCKNCKKSIRRTNFDGHKCKETVCGLCSTKFCTIIEKDNHFNDAKKNKSWSKCDKCFVWCPDSNCLAKHSEKCKGDVKKCQECKKWVKTDHYENHICGEKFCRNCENYYCGEHRCFITPLKDYIIQDDKKHYPTWVQTIYAYDFESMFDDNNNHIVNLCIVKQLFGDKAHTFNNIEDFVKFAVSCKNTTFIAHNGKAYDNWMVHKYIIKHTAHRPTKLILAGNKIMYMKVKTVRFIDSLNHIAQGLATFPKTFGLTEMKKGFFPYLFNIAENQNYIGSIPDKHFFNPSNMSVEKYNEFNKWYETQKNIIYDFKKELYEYCESDVDILKRSLEIYITDAIKTNGINPLKCSTIASYCLSVFRTNYLEENTIAVLTKEEYDFCKRGFFGGRTEVFKMFKTWTDTQIKEGVHGKYVDIQSLYPSVQFFDDLPCGTPKWDNEPIYETVTEYIDNHYGYIECDIECPQDLHIPLLPEKKNNKLMFDLVDKSKKVYSSIELHRAVEVGYKITKIYRSLSFEKTNDLFTGYIQNFLKIKTESAGYDGDDIDSYIERYYNNCGVRLEKDKIKKNNGMKLLAKICLNSLWGKFGQNDELPTTAYIKNDAWFKLLQRHIDKKVELKNEVLIDDDTLYVSYIEKEESRTSLMTTNLGLAGFVTANARLRLYKELYKLSDRVIYCDTDSIIYEYDKSKYNVVEGDCLGEWELEDNGDLKEVYALAPKTYGYTSINGKQSYKCKGITLNYGNKTHFTFDKLKTLIVGDDEGKHEKIITYSDDFIKDTKTGNIFTKTNVPKDTNYCEEEFKRQFFKDGTSTPFKNSV